MSTTKISYALIIRRTLVTCTGVLFAIMAYRFFFDVGREWKSFREKFELEILAKKGTLVSQPFEVYKQTHFYEIEVRRDVAYTKDMKLKVNIKLIDHRNKIINDFDADFAYNSKKGYSSYTIKKVFKTKQRRKLYLVMKLLESNVKKKKSTYLRNKLDVTVRGVNDTIPSRYYYRAFLYSFFAMVIFLFIPSKTF